MGIVLKSINGVFIRPSVLLNMDHFKCQMRWKRCVTKGLISAKRTSIMPEFLHSSIVCIKANHGLAHDHYSVPGTLTSARRHMSFHRDYGSNHYLRMHYNNSAYDANDLLYDKLKPPSGLVVSIVAY